MKQDQVTDKNLCMSMINQLKWDATCLTQKILETSDQQLRQDYINVLDRTFAEQKQLYDLANQYGWHQPMMADQSMISKVQSGLHNLSNEIQQSMMSIHHQQAQQQGIQAPTYYNTMDFGQGMTNSVNQQQQLQYQGLGQQQNYNR
ncbi:spore coat protein [Desulforamulus aquiferis]|uniref:Spore coat protein n=1 Tax=Desulforamulus aquiferis TaxID=1397668 RepID=A0AAW7ZDW8_9FIRM|nr:spore coat protein [Desulforamulus aquiferis]MDO7787468.1 spore coat protein [Desulforamulus aquiferis]RYD05430.1 hypothetical protein N752_08785 [Desulforamulus aquiferis]